jgi:pimeloyl-ACP methyl ester carboxylesterase
MSKRLLRALLAAGMFIASAAGAQPLTCRDTGAGAPVLLIPGLSGCVHGWRNVVPLVEAAGCRAIVVEPLGVGSSPRPAGADYSLTAQADRIAALLDSLHTGPVVIVAHGVSVSMALRIAVRRPDLVRAIVAIEGGPAESAASPEFAAALGKANLAAKILGLGVVRGRFRGELEASSGDPSWLDEQTLRAYLAGPAADFGAARRAFRAMAEVAEPDSLRPHLPKVACTVTLLLGGATHRGSLPEEQFDAMRKGLPRLVIESVPGAGHFLHEERPEVVAAEAIALSRVELPAGGDRMLGAVAPHSGSDDGRRQ